ncbi:hypothetical protein ACG2LH_15275 [Zhouia sp. PK063]|uniref:hypothetical protein n=1 Tax=Zhouia sp. PK063 TaxID=3373602 RepID=UPI003791DADA
MNLQDTLTELFWKHLIAAHPERIFSLDKNYSVNQYLKETIQGLAPELEQWKSQGKSSRTIISLAFAHFKEGLGPSRYLYLEELLQQEFSTIYQQLQQSGTLTYELVKMIGAANHVFEAIGFSSVSSNSKRLRKHLIAFLADYLHQSSQSL